MLQKMHSLAKEHGGVVSTWCHTDVSGNESCGYVIGTRTPLSVVHAEKEFGGDEVA